MPCWLLRFMEKSTLILLLAWMPMAAIPQEFLLVKRSGASEAETHRFHHEQGCTYVRFKHFPWNAVKLPAGREAEVTRHYTKSALFSRCQKPIRYSVNVTPNDPLYPQLWGLQKIEAARGWDVVTSNSVVVAVIDTGVDYGHPDLLANLWTGPIGEHGYTALGGVISIGGEDDHRHGTHVAGTIGAVGNNGIGVAGINWSTRILSLKFIGAGGFGYSHDAALCIDRMIDLKMEGHNIRVCNNSWGVSGFVDALLEDAFTAATDAGILSACAAGNDFSNTDIVPHSPSALPVDGIISVLASDENDGKAGFSNYGAVTTDVAAPGVGIVSLALTNGYRELSGTSMASPHVAGVAAALFGLNPSLTVAQCKAVLLHQDSLDQAEFLQTSTFGGRLNMAKALGNAFSHIVTNNHAPVFMPIGTLTLKTGEHMIIEATATDADGDSLRYSVLLRATSDTLGQPFPVTFAATNRVEVTNFGTSAIAVGLEARFFVSDGKGGTAVKAVNIFLEENLALVRHVTASVSLNPIAVHPFWEVFVGSNSGSNDANYALFFSSYNYPSGATCCFPANTSIPYYRGLQPGPNLIRAYVVDSRGNLGNSQRLLVDTGTTGIYAQEVKVSLNRTRGNAPLRVTADMSATDPDGSHGLWYYSRLWSSDGFFERSPPFANIHNPVQTFTLTNLGTTAVEFLCYDTNTALVDKVVQLFTVLPSGPEMTATRFGQSMTLNWTQADPSDVLEVSLNLNTWAPFRTGLPPVAVQLQSGMLAFRVRKP